MKKDNHQVWFQDDIVYNEIHVPFVDTSVTSTLYQQLPNYRPNYSGDLPDFNKKSLMEIKKMSQQLKPIIQEKKDFLDSLKSEPKQTQQQPQTND